MQLFVSQGWIAKSEKLDTKTVSLVIEADKPLLSVLTNWEGHLEF